MSNQSNNYGNSRKQEHIYFWSLLTVKHCEDFLHHLPQNKDVGLSLWWSSCFPMLAIFTQLAQVAVLVFGMGIGCGQILQTWHPYSQMTKSHIAIKNKTNTMNKNSVQQHYRRLGVRVERAAVWAWRKVDVTSLVFWLSSSQINNCNKKTRWLRDLVPKTNEYVTFWKIVPCKMNGLFVFECIGINLKHLWQLVIKWATQSHLVQFFLLSYSYRPRIWSHNQRFISFLILRYANCGYCSL